MPVNIFSFIKSYVTWFNWASFFHVQSLHLFCWCGFLYLALNRHMGLIVVWPLCMIRIWEKAFCHLLQNQTELGFMSKGIVYFISLTVLPTLSRGIKWLECSAFVTVQRMEAMMMLWGGRIWGYLKGLLKASSLNLFWAPTPGLTCANPCQPKPYLARIDLCWELQC